MLTVMRQAWQRSRAADNLSGSRGAHLGDGRPTARAPAMSSHDPGTYVASIYHDLRTDSASRSLYIDVMTRGASHGSASMHTD